MGEWRGCGLGTGGTVGVAIVCREVGIEIWDIDRSGTMRADDGVCGWSGIGSISDRAGDVARRGEAVRGGENTCGVAAANLGGVEGGDTRGSGDVACLTLSGGKAGELGLLLLERE